MNADAKPTSARPSPEPASPESAPPRSYGSLEPSRSEGPATPPLGTTRPSTIVTRQPERALDCVSPNLPSPKGVEDFDQDADDEDAARLVAPIDEECHDVSEAVACAPCRGPVPALRL